MQLISKFDKGFSFLLCIIDIFSKHVWVVPLKDKESASIVNAFQKIFDKSGRKPNKIWVVAQRFLRTLKNKIDIYMTSVSKNVDIDKLDDIVNEYDNTYHRTIKMKPVDVQDNTYFEFEKEVNNKDPKFKVGDHTRISKYKNIFAKLHMSSWSEEVFIIKNVKNTVPWTYVINDLNGEKIIGTFYEKGLQKTNQKEFIIEKVIK